MLSMPPGFFSAVVWPVIQAGQTSREPRQRAKTIAYRNLDKRLFARGPAGPRWGGFADRVSRDSQSTVSLLETGHNN